MPISDRSCHQAPAPGSKRPEGFSNEHPGAARTSGAAALQPRRASTAPFAQQGRPVRQGFHDLTPVFAGHFGPSADLVDRAETSRANPCLGMHHADAHAGRLDLVACPDRRVVVQIGWSFRWRKRSSAPCRIYAAATASITSERRFRVISASSSALSAATVERRSSQKVMGISANFARF